MKLADVSVKRPVGVIMVVLIVLALGLVSLKNLVIDLFPEIDLPIAVVATSYPGAAPEDVENLVSKPLESALSTIEGIDTLSSQSQVSVSMVVIQFKSGTDLDNALIDVREKVDQVKGSLPDSADDPSVLKFDPQDMPIIYLGLTGKTPEVLQEIADDDIIPFLERQNGVASVTTDGGKEREIQVELDVSKLNRYGVTSSQIVQALAAENLSTPAGEVTKGQQDMQIRVEGEFTSLEDIKNTMIHLTNGEEIKLDDVATVRDTYQEQTSLALVDNQDALVLSIMKQSDANTVDVSDEVISAVEELQDRLPEGVDLFVAFDTSMFIRQSINSVTSNLMYGGLFSVLVLLLFLRSIRATLVIGISIPIAVISTFILMYFTGQTLNIISMGGLALGVGMMVDNSIVILENIFVYRQNGASIKEAAVKGANELGSAVVASTMTSLVVFLPIVFVQGIAGDLFRPLALTVSFSLIASLIVALSMVPMLASKFITDKSIERTMKKNWMERGLDAVLSFYKKLLSKVLKFRKTTLAAVLALLIGSFMLVPNIGMEFVPSSDQGLISITVETPTGTKLEETQKVVEEVHALLEPYMNSIKTELVMVGSSNDGGISTSTNTATFNIELVSAEEREIHTTELMQILSNEVEHIAGAEITVSEVQGGISSGSPITIALNGPNQEELEELAQQVVWKISEIEGVVNAESSASEGNAELNIIVDRDVASQYGLSYSEIASEVVLSVNGQTATYYREDGDEIDVNVILPEEDRSTISNLNTLQIQTATGQLVPLSAVASFEQVQSAATLQRENQQRQVNVTSDVVNRDIGSVASEIEMMLQSMNFPDGYTYSMGGEAEDMQESFADLGLALIFSIFLVYAVMAIQFESFAHPLVIMFAIPTTVIGVILGLFITGYPLSTPVLIGLIMLAGIVVNNAIVLVDYINTLRERGMDRMEAILEGAPTRVRPILMTTLTTILGMIPLALGWGEGSETQAPMAIAVIFGLATSSLFTLLLVPVMYTYIDGFGGKIKRLFSRKKKSNPAKEVPVS